MTKEKAWGLFRLRLNEVFNPFCLYGLDVYIPEAKVAIEVLAEQLLCDLGIEKKEVNKECKD